MTKPMMSDDDVFRTLAQEVSQITGVILGEKQHSLIQSRLIKRVRDLNFKTGSEYWTHFLQNREEEMPYLISLLTTHHTFFFREWAHFEFLAQELPDLVKRLKAQGRNKIKVWSAACSMGHEVYSLSMFLDNKLKTLAPDMTYEILGTDVDEKSVQIAANGVYRWSEVQKIPSIYLEKNWARGTGEIADYVKIRSALKASCRFAPANLLNLKATVKDEKFDYIFCRNVFIYFTREQIKAVVDQFQSYLTPEGRLILGLSESLYDLDVKVKHLGKSIYAPSAVSQLTPAPATQAPSAAKPAATATAKPAPISTPPPMVEEKPVRVVCIDDSPSVLKLLTKIFGKNPKFKVVGTAPNGIEATKLLKTVEADVMTLDIHMPEQDGIEYLRTNFKKGHPPVVIISSVSRGDAKFALKALEYGACDYIEKPSLDNLAITGDEILAKTHMAAKNAETVDLSKIEVERSFLKDVIMTKAHQKAMTLSFSLSDKAKASYVLKTLIKPHPPVFLIPQAMDSLKEELLPLLNKELGVTVNMFDPKQEPKENQFYFVSVSDIDTLAKTIKGKPLSAGVLGSWTVGIEDQIKKLAPMQTLCEDIETLKVPLMRGLNRVPYTSFAYDLYSKLADLEKKAA